MAKTPEDNTQFQILKQSIRDKNPGSLYFFHGEETFLLNYYLEQMKRILIDEITESFNFHKLTSETFDVQSFADAVENLPMMAERTMVWVDDIDIFKLPEAERTKISEIFSDIPDYCTVVFTFITTAWKPDKRLQKLWSAVNDFGSVVEFTKQDQRSLIAWITRHFAANQKKISQDLCAYLIDITDGTMTTLLGEIAKISAYSGADTIVKSDIDAVTEPALDAVVFQMTDYLGTGEYGQALHKLQQLLKMQEEPLVILGAIGSHFRRLSAAKTLHSCGKNYNDLMRIYRMNEYPAKKTMNAAKNFSEGFCALANELVMEADYQMKTSYGDADRLLEVLILRLAQEARND